MQLIDLRTEILAHGFDPVTFSPARLNQYINDGYFLICRRVDYYIDESSQAITTTAGQSTFPFPTDFARIRSLVDLDRNIEIEGCSLREIDRSTVTQGTPSFYAIDGANIHLYPTADGAHNLLVRYWKLPAALVNDTDVPNLPTDWHHLLWVYACWICYEAEDDSSMGQYWMQRFTTELAEFAADQKFPEVDYPVQAAGMWEGDKQLSPSGWSLYLGY